MLFIVQVSMSMEACKQIDYFKYIFRIFFSSRWNILCILKTCDRIILLLENGFKEWVKLCEENVKSNYLKSWNHDWFSFHAHTLCCSWKSRVINYLVCLSNNWVQWNKQVLSLSTILTIGFQYYRQYGSFSQHSNWLMYYSPWSTWN
jgi:hypothetical protein